MVALHAANKSVGWAWQGGTAANEAFWGLTVTAGGDSAGGRGGGHLWAVGSSAGRLWAPPDGGGSGSVGSSGNLWGYLGSPIPTPGHGPGESVASGATVATARMVGGLTGWSRG